MAHELYEDEKGAPSERPPQGMEFNRTRDHDVVRGWIEGHGGTPVVYSPGNGAPDMPSVNFGRWLPDEFRQASWEEFFDMFDSRNLIFRYSGEVEPGQEELSYTFVSDKNPPDSAREDETKLMENTTVAEENTYRELRDED